MNQLSIVIIMGTLLLVLVFLSAVFSGSETAISSIQMYKFETHYEKKKKTSIYRMSKKLIENYNMSLSTILIGNTLVNVGTSTFATIFFTKVLEMAGVNDAISLATGVATGVITFVVLLFGEFFPKSIARKYSMKILQLTSWFIYILFYLLWPINWILNKLFKNEESISANEKELDTLIDIVNKEGVLENTEAMLVSNALLFDEIRLRKIMTKLKDVEFVEKSWTKKKVLNKFIESDYSRLMVRNKKKNWIGFITLKDLIKSKLNWNGKIKKPLYFSQNDTLDDVLQSMKIHRIHIGLVTQKRNSEEIVGLITMEDLLEALVGEIYDESDEVDAIHEINDFTWKVDGNISTLELNKNFNWNIKKEMTFKDWMGSKKKIIKDNYLILSKFSNKKHYYLIEKIQDKY